MKRRYQFIRIVIFTLLVTSCSSDFLEIEEKNKENVTPWQNKDFVYKSMVNLYAPYQKTHDRGYFYLACASDDMVTGRKSNEANDLKNFKGSGNERDLDEHWIRRYGAIRTALEIIQNIDKVEGINKEEKDMFLGESYFTLGFMYWELCYPYANDESGQGIPILDINTDIYEAAPRASSIIENFKLIEASLLKAADLLPYFDPSKSGLKDRAHKTAALAYLAKTYLYWASYDKSKYIKAVETANRIINSGKHKLLGDFKDVFAIKNNYSTEYIWSVPSSASLDEGSILPGALFENKGWEKKDYPNSPAYNGWGYFQPTKELYDAYVSGDKRRDITLFKEGDKFTYFGVDFTWTRTNYNFTGLMFAKYIQPFADESTVSKNGDHPCTDLNVPLMRYAEVLLIKAEALIADGKNGDTPLNKVRNRAGLPNISGATMEDLKRERRCELAGEFADRHFDLVRWGDAQRVYSKPLHGMALLKDKDGKAIPGKYEEAWPSRTFNPSVHNVWPIPPNVISRSLGVIKQNKGY